MATTLNTDPFAALDGVQDAVFGEAAVLTPQQEDQYVANVADGNRPAAIIRGVFSAGPARDDIRGRSSGGAFAGATRVSVVRAGFWLPQANAAALGYEILKGDKLALTARPGVPVYVVTEVQPTDLGDVNLKLVREGAE